jgi:hypothetical protein
MPNEQPAKPKSKLRWYQFSLRTLLIVVTLFAVACSWFATEYRRAVRRGQAFRKVEMQFYTYGGHFSPPWYSSWFHKMAGDGECYNISFLVTNAQSYITNDDMMLIGRFDELAQLSINFQETVTDEGLQYIESLQNLSELSLSETKITDKGLSYLMSMKVLESLDLSNTEITDSGLERLTNLNKLQRLILSGTKVTDAGVSKLQKALPNCKIER